MEPYNVFSGLQETASPAPGIRPPQDDDVDYTKELAEQYLSSATEWRQQVVEDRDFSLGAQITQKKQKALRKRGITPYTFDFLHQKIDNAVAMLTSNKPQWSGTGREDSDARVARLFSYVMAYVFEINKGITNLKIMIKDAYISGMGWLVFYYDPTKDYGKGDICFKQMDTLNVLVDPNSKEPFFTDAAHIIIRNIITHEQFQRFYPQYVELLSSMETMEGDLHPVGTNYGLQGQGSAHRSLNANMTKKYLELDRYSKIKVPMIHAYEPNSGFEKLISPEQAQEYFQKTPVAIVHSAQGTQHHVDPKSVRDAMNLVQSFGNIFHQVQTQEGQVQFFPGDESVEHPEGIAPIPNSTKEVQIVPMMLFVERKVVQANEILVDRIKRSYIVGNVKVYEEILPIEDYPLVPLTFEYNRDPFPISPVRRARPFQEYINSIGNIIVEHAANTASIRMMYPRGGYNEAELNKKWNTPGTALIPYEAEAGQIVPIYPPPLPAELYRNFESARQSMDELLGVYPSMQGDPQNSPETFKGTVTLDEFGQRRMKSKKDDIEASLNQCARVIVQMIQAYYNHYKIIRLLRPNGDYTSVVLNADKAFHHEDLTVDAEFVVSDTSIGRYDIVTVAGSMLPSNRWALAEYYMELYKVGLLDREEVLRKTDVADVESVLKRMSEIEQLKQVVGQLQGEVKRLSGDLQTAQRESVNALKRMEVNQFEKELNEQTVRAQAATEVYRQRLADNVMLQKKIKDVERKGNQRSKSGKS